MTEIVTGAVVDKLCADLVVALNHRGVGVRVAARDLGIWHSAIVVMRRNRRAPATLVQQLRAWIDATEIPEVDPDEEWRPVVGYEGFYEVSNMGRVRSVPRTVMHSRNGPMKLNSRVLRPNTHPAGHRMVDLRRDGESYMAKVHRLVLEAFAGPAPDGYDGCHNDGDPNNNRAENLRWDTHGGNMRDRYWHARNPGMIRPDVLTTQDGTMP